MRRRGVNLLRSVNLASHSPHSISYSPLSTFPELPVDLPTGISWSAADVAPPPLDYARVATWIEAVIEGYGYRLGGLDYLFCSDAFLLDLNRTHLDHDTYTDIITFPTAELPRVGAEIFISTERVAENALRYGATLETELLRVIIHGVLHLCGISDKGEAAATMRAAEAAALVRYTDTPHTAAPRTDVE